MTLHRGLGFLFIFFSILLEACGQLLLKKGAHSGRPGKGLRAALHRTVGNTWVQAGLGAFLLEAVCWTFALHFLPLDVAFPMGSACFVAVAVLSKMYLHEQVGRRRWLGIAFVLAGVVLIGAGHGR